jgi:hypothetical protein
LAWLRRFTELRGSIGPEDDFMLRQKARVSHDSRQETASGTADEKIDRRAPLGYFNYAVSFHAAADLVFSEGLEATHPDAPTTFLYYQAVELYLKAFLRLTGDSAAQLWRLRHDLRRLKSRAIRRGLTFGMQESQVLDWMAATEAWTSARYLETGSTWTPRGDLIWEGCSNLKKTVAEAFRGEGQPIQFPRLKRPFYDPFRRYK